MKGKAKADFEQWYKQKYFLSVEGNCDSCGCGIGLPFGYDRLPPTMQQGVLLEFFRERGYDLQIRRNYRLLNEVVYQDNFFYEILFNKEFLCESRLLPDYSTAFTHAIDKACDVYGGEG